jgi:hypothetical protein
LPAAGTPVGHALLHVMGSKTFAAQQFHGFVDPSPV